MELSIVIPCLNESETIEICIQKAFNFLHRHNIDGEVIVADNGSIDGSLDIARRNGAKIVCVDQKGYGSALMGGIKAAKGEYVIMGDADDTYDFSALMPFVEKLREGFEMVVGNRFLGGIEDGAMPFLHKYLGNPVLTAIGRMFFKSPCKDFHCGLRGFSREAVLRLGANCPGMEFASELIVKAHLNNLKITEVPTTLSKSGRSRPPHLNTWRDGWRHLRFLLLYCPRWLFFYPGVLLIMLGIALGVPLLFTEISVGFVVFDIHTLFFASVFFIIGYQSLVMSAISRVYAAQVGVLPEIRRFSNITSRFNLEKVLIAGTLVFFTGAVLSLYSVVRWHQFSGLGDFDPRIGFRILIPAFTLIITGVQTMLTSFVLELLSVKKGSYSS
ncbi:Glycosyl transferase, group 2 family [Candidatus Electrothrix aarhusensis]